MLGQRDEADGLYPEPSSLHLTHEIRRNTLPTPSAEGLEVFLIHTGCTHVEACQYQKLAGVQAFAGCKSDGARKH